MASGFRMQMVGGKELDRALKELPKAMQKSTLVSAMRKAAQPVLKDARARAPVGATGNLKKSLAIGTKLTGRQAKGRSRAKSIPQIFIGARWPTGAHAHIIEFGRAGVPARPFLRPAWDANKERVLKSLRGEVWKVLAKKARQLAAKAEAGKLSRTARRALGG